MPNITFIFETSPNTKSKEKKVWGTWHIMSPPSEKVGGTRPPCPPPNCAHDHRKPSLLQPTLAKDLMLINLITIGNIVFLRDTSGACDQS